MMIARPNWRAVYGTTARERARRRGRAGASRRVGSRVSVSVTRRLSAFVRHRGVAAGPARAGAAAPLSAAGSSRGSPWPAASARRGCRRTRRAEQSSTILPASMKITLLLTLLAKPISCVTTHHGHAFLGQPHHHVEHLADHLGVERRRRLVEQHHDRVHRQRAGDGHALLLAAGQLARELVLVRRQADAVEHLQPRLSARPASGPAP